MDKVFRKNVMNCWLFGIACFISIACYSNNQEQFLQGLKLYKERKFAESLKAFQAINPKGPAVWYNIGNCYYCLDKKVDAYAYWLRAQFDLHPTVYMEAKSRIEQLLQDNNDNKSSTYFLFDLLLQVSLYFPLIVWQSLFLLVWLVLFFFGMHLLRKNKFLFFGLPVLTAILSIVLMIKYKALDSDVAITLDDATVYVGPDTRFSAHFTIRPQQEVVIAQVVQDWFKIKSGSRVGWIPAQKLKRINQIV